MSEHPKKRLKIDDFLSFNIPPSNSQTSSSLPSSLPHLQQQSIINQNEKKLQRKKTKLLNVCKIFQKFHEAAKELLILETENFILKSFKSQDRLRIFAFEWNEDNFTYFKTMFSNFNKFFDTDFRQTRYFFVCSFETLWKNYSFRRFKHFYEIILEKKNCYLYFDIEKEPGVNKHIENTIMKKLKNIIKKEFEFVYSKYDIKVDIQKDFFCLSSCSERKFSYHVIVKPKIKDYSGEERSLIFDTNIDCGNFVRNMLKKLIVQKESDKEIRDLLFFNKMKNGIVVSKSIIDKTVYSKNRHFRLIFSTKKGKREAFTVDTDLYPNLDERQIFMQSLITNVDEKNSFVLTCREFLVEKDMNPNIESETSIPRVNTRRSRPNFQDVSDSVKNKISNFILKEINEHCGTSAFIRSTQEFDRPTIIVFYIGNNKFCYNIGREHKSNHVFYVANIDKREYYQKCTDPQCSGFKSTPRAIPIDCFE